MITNSKVVVVTGASAGVGRATAKRFAQGGADVALLARGQAGLEGARRDVESEGRKAVALAVDVADAQAVERAAATIEDTLGPIDVWINDAMTTVFGEFIDITSEEFRRVTEVTYLGYVFGTRTALTRMLPRDRGVIVQVGSALAYRGIPLQSAYCGAKYAIRGFTDSVRCELLHRKSNVWMTMVQMPALNTPQFEWCENKMGHRSQPVPPIYEPELAADAIWFAAHHRRREVFVGGSTAIAIVGNKMFPRFGDWYLAHKGYSSQQFDGAPPNPDGNLWDPKDADRDHGARGEFSARARRRSFELWASKHQVLTALGGLGLVSAAILAARALR